MIEASKLKAGMTFETADGKLIRVLEASHHKPGKGNTIMRMKLRDVRTGSTFDTSYRPEEKFEQAIIETVPAQYLYKMDETAYFMNTETYDQYEIPVVNVENELLYILENSDVKIQFYGTEVIGVTVPTTVELTVVGADYRYFPEPDLPLFEISDEWIEEMRTELPEFPKERRARYVSDLGLSDYDASQLTANKVTSDFFEKAVALGGDAKQVSNWLQGEVAQFLNAESKTLEQIELTPENLVEMIAIIEDGTISSKIAKKVFVHLAKNGGGAREYVEKAGMVQISDPAVLIPIIHQVFADNEAAVADFKSGKRNADKAFTGFLMKATKGQANPQVALKLLAQELAKLKED